MRTGQRPAVRAAEARMWFWGAQGSADRTLQMGLLCELRCGLRASGCDLCGVTPFGSETGLQPGAACLLSSLVSAPPPPPPLPSHTPTSPAGPLCSNAQCPVQGPEECGLAWVTWLWQCWRWAGGLMRGVHGGVGCPAEGSSHKHKLPVGRPAAGWHPLLGCVQGREREHAPHSTAEEMGLTGGPGQVLPHPQLTLLELQVCARI